ncbi:hypothetical protein [Iningainema tapete]|uniref:Uncharacterized protein n=1 Tax=Iningainema tapete BLCC-T55 TaxID=2748662 RepID=A0A8J7C958_9CYAN|nr:hypothetical protein [Iningainema tapete]MBD2777719.1 hypothetical protein [Iningainema tapete BLCC-T55]
MASRSNFTKRQGQLGVKNSQKATVIALAFLSAPQLKPTKVACVFETKVIAYMNTRTTIACNTLAPLRGGHAFKSQKTSLVSFCAILNGSFISAVTY